MADKSFGVKDFNLIGSSGTPLIESPNNLIINASNVAISTDLSVGGSITSGDVSNTVSGRWSLTGDGSNYFFTGVGITAGNTSNPILYLSRGKIYEFVNTQSSSHPFEIRLSNGGAAYSVGISTYTSGSNLITKFEIPMNSPNTLFYQCTVHSGMGNTISVYPSTI